MAAPRLSLAKGDDEEKGETLNNNPLRTTVLAATSLARPPMNQEQFDAKFAYKEERPDYEPKYRVKKFFRKYTNPFTSCASFKKTILGFFPILQWLPNYSLSWFPYDVMGGLVLGAMQFPQGIGNAVIAKVPAISGVYTSFLPPLVYTVFGGSKFNSLGSFAVVALMCGQAVTRLSGPTIDPSNNATMLMTDYERPTPGQVASSLSFLVGMFHLIMAVLHLEFLTTYFSDQVVAGFNTGSSIHAFVAQLEHFFGYEKMQQRSGAGHLVMEFYDVCRMLPQTNLWNLLVGVCSVIFLIVGKDVLGPILQRIFGRQIPIPLELFLIIIANILSQYLHFHDKLNMKIVGDVPQGFPVPAVPRFDYMADLIPDALAISVVVVAIHISIAKFLAKKCDYEVDANQEFVALGASEAISSFIPIYTPACSLARTLLCYDVGAKTLVTNVVSSVFVLIMMLFVGKWFEDLPMTVLSAIIMVALKGMFNKFYDLVLLWPVSKIDFSIWLISFAGTVFIDVTPGLLISIIYALLTTVFRQQWPRWHLSGNVQGAPDYEDSNRYDHVYFFHGICIFRFDSPLLFTNADRFKKNASKAFASWERSHEYNVYTVEKTQFIQEHNNANCTQDFGDQDEALSRHFIIDCSGITFVDYMGVSAIKEIYLGMRKRDVIVYFAAAEAAVRELFGSSGFYGTVPKENFYPTIQDAVAIARSRQKERGDEDVQYSFCQSEASERDSQRTESTVIVESASHM